MFAMPYLPMQIEILGGILCLAFVAIWFIIWLLIAIWVYRDAESRGMSGVLWLLIVILLGLIGIIIYLVIRKDKPQYPHGAPYPPQQYGQYPPPPPPPPAYQQAPTQEMRMCPGCGRQIPVNYNVCPHCGRPAAPPPPPRQ
jgi:hypothetical protein